MKRDTRESVANVEPSWPKLYWLWIGVAACAPVARDPERPGSRGLHANEHLEAARQHDEAARARSTWPDTRVTDNTGRADQMLIGSTWNRQWNTEDQERAAAMHRGEAQAIYEWYERACSGRPSSEVSVSPIVRYGTGGGTTADGV